MSPDAVDPNTRNTNRTSVIVALITLLGVCVPFIWVALSHAKSSPQSQTPKTIAFTGRILTEDGKPIPGASVIATQDQKLGENFLSDSNGQFQVQVSPDTVSFRLIVNANGYGTVSVQAVPRRTGPEEIVLHPAIKPGQGTLNRPTSPSRTPAVPPKTEPQPPTQNCPNGICIGGNNTGTAEVKNYYGPQTLPPRTIDGLHMQAGLKKLESVRVISSVTLIDVGTTKEVHALGMSVYQVFHLAGWDITASTSRGFSSSYSGLDGMDSLDGQGISCTGYRNDDVAAQAAIDAMSAMGVPCRRFHHREDDLQTDTKNPTNITIVMGPQSAVPDNE